MTVKIKFLGAAGSVTGSKYLVSNDKRKILVDAGLFQGVRSWRERNWDTPEFNPEEIDAVLLTHAHIDHSGMLPRFSKQGLKCPIYCTKATKQLAQVLLPDSAYLQEEEAAYRQKKSRSRHRPPLALYTKADAEQVLESFTAQDFGTEVELFDGISAKWTQVGHIVGAASVTLKIDDKVINFSGDMGRYNIPILKDPQPVEFGDLLLMESTYGDRVHPELDVCDLLEDIINHSYKRGGVTLIPSFAVGRAQLILYYLRELKEANRIPDIPVIVDSPMASDATHIYRKNPDCYDAEALEIFKEGTMPFEPSKLYFTKSREESKQLNGIDEPMIIISASGMLSGGRILHHLRQRISSPANTLVFVGYQAPGSRGAWIQSGAKTFRLFKEDIAINAHVESISGLSAHADYNEMLRWCKSCKAKPGRVAVVHGEDDARASFKKKLEDEMDWDAFVPKYLEEILL